MLLKSTSIIIFFMAAIFSFQATGKSYKGMRYEIRHAQNICVVRINGYSHIKTGDKILYKEEIIKSQKGKCESATYFYSRLALKADTTYLAIINKINGINYSPWAMEVEKENNNFSELSNEMSVHNNKAFLLLPSTINSESIERFIDPKVNVKNKKIFIQHGTSKKIKGNGFFVENYYDYDDFMIFLNEFK